MGWRQQPNRGIMKASCRAKYGASGRRKTTSMLGRVTFSTYGVLLDPVIPFQWNQYLLSHDLFSKRVHCFLLNSAVTSVGVLICPFGLRTNTGDKAVCRIIL